MGASPAQNQVKQVETIGFIDALRAATKGQKIHKLEWVDTGFYVCFDGEKGQERLKLHKPDGKFYEWILSIADTVGDDWIVL